MPNLVCSDVMFAQLLGAKLVFNIIKAPWGLCQDLLHFLDEKKIFFSFKVVFILELHINPYTKPFVGKRKPFIFSLVFRNACTGYTLLGPTHKKERKKESTLHCQNIQNMKNFINNFVHRKTVKSLIKYP